MRRTFLLSLIVAAIALVLDVPEAADAGEHAATQEKNDDGRAVYLVYYWRAKPGKMADYSDYITRVAEPIDEDARKAGVFEWVRTYTQAIQTGAPGSDWTHMRVFRLTSFASWDDFSAGLDAATTRVFPDADKRRELMAPGPGLRDLVRQEIWRDLP
jgi:hypothetical protein